MSDCWAEAAAEWDAGHRPWPGSRRPLCAAWYGLDTPEEVSRSDYRLRPRLLPPANGESRKGRR
jgi:hypothetical protein